MNRARRGFLKGVGWVGAGGFAGGLIGCARKLAAPPQAAPRMGVAAQDLGGQASLKESAASRGLLYGCAVNVGKLGQDEAYRRLVIEQAGIVVAENSMKWGPMRPLPGGFRWDEADTFVAFAAAHGMVARGHNLCWHRQLPEWFEGYATQENAAGLLTDHIKTVVRRYQGKIQSWDVVNEAVDPKDGRSDGLRESPWLKLVGPSYIELAFRTARATDPGAKLTYNDFGIEGEDEESTKKRSAVLELVRQLHAKKLIDAVGVQSHIAAEGYYGAGLTHFMAAVRGMGLEIYVTEMDVNDRKLRPDVAARDRAVARMYGDYLRLVLKEPAVKAVLTWGITDRYTWLNGEDAREDHLPERCLPFDGEFKPVEAYFAMREGFAGSPD